MKRLLLPIVLFVDGGLNPRINGAQSKTGTKLAVEPMVANDAGW